MKNERLSKMTLKQLREIKESVAQAITIREREERAELKTKLAEVAVKHGFHLDELFGRGRKASGVVGIGIPTMHPLRGPGAGANPTGS